MLLKPITLCFTGMLWAVSAFATPADSSVTITNAKNEYQFVYNNQLNRVEIKQQLSNTYISNNYQVSYPISEIYTDHISINDVRCKVDGHTPHDFKPKFTYYDEDDVFYSDARVCYFPMLLGKKGSIANVTFDETLDDPRYFTNIYFADAALVQHMEVTIKVPRWMKIEVKELNFNTYDIKKTTQYNSSEDADVITYTVNNIPAMEQETNSPGPTYLYPHLLILCKSATAGGKSVDYFNTLADQYAWYHSLVQSIGTDENIINAKAKDITAGLTNDIDKIKAIYYYVQNNIRYIAFEDGVAGFKPEKADEVLRKKYGDCKGMANLTKSLLVAAGYDARLCWLGTNHIAYDYQTPSMAVDNHMICALLYKGKTYYLDATESYIGFNEYAERIQGREVLMEDGDKFILNKIPFAAPTQNADVEYDVISINGSNLTGKVEHTWRGEDKEDILSGINSVKNEDEDKAVKKYLSGGNDDYAISNMVLSNVANHDKDLKVSYDFEFKNAVNVFSKVYYIDLDTKKELGDAVIKQDERKHDFWFSHKMNISRQIELTIPAGYKPANIPANLVIVNPGYEFHISYTVLAGKILYKKNILIKSISIPKTAFAKWNGDIEQLNKTYTQNITLKPTE